MYKNIIINEILNNLIELDPAVYKILEDKIVTEYMKTKIKYNNKLVVCDQCEANIFNVIINGDEYTAECCKCGNLNYNI